MWLPSSRLSPSPPASILLLAEGWHSGFGQAVCFCIDISLFARSLQSDSERSARRHQKNETVGERDYERCFSGSKFAERWRWRDDWRRGKHEAKQVIRARAVEGLGVRCGVVSAEGGVLPSFAPEWLTKAREARVRAEQGAFQVAGHVRPGSPTKDELERRPLTHCSGS